MAPDLEDTAIRNDVGKSMKIYDFQLGRITCSKFHELFFATLIFLLITSIAAKHKPDLPFANLGINSHDIIPKDRSNDGYPSACKTRL